MKLYWALIIGFLLCMMGAEAKKQTPESASDRVKRMHKEHNKLKQDEWNNEYLKSNNVKNSRNQQARLKTKTKTLKKEQRLKESKAGSKETLLKDFGDKFKRDRGDEL